MKHASSCSIVVHIGKLYSIFLGAEQGSIIMYRMADREARKLGYESVGKDLKIL